MTDHPAPRPQEPRPLQGAAAALLLQLRHRPVPGRERDQRAGVAHSRPRALLLEEVEKSPSAGSHENNNRRRDHAEKVPRPAKTARPEHTRRAVGTAHRRASHAPSSRLGTGVFARSLHAPSPRRAGQGGLRRPRPTHTLWSHGDPGPGLPPPRTPDSPAHLTPASRWGPVAPASGGPQGKRGLRGCPQHLTGTRGAAGLVGYSKPI